MSDEEDALLPVETFRPVDNYSEVDPNFTDFADDVGEDVDLTEDELEPPEVDEEDEALVPYWATFELHGRNLDQQTSWRNLASEEFDGNFEVEVEGLTAGARWEFRIRLIDRNGRYSKWSEPLQITLPVDFTPPPRPTPPLLNELLGFIRLGWDGELEGTIPSDMSHTNLRIQQMHPEGDPDGEPGDPRLMARLQAEGWYAAGLLPNVPHRAFLTAVDTTGNESPWSDFTEFHPEPAFDTAELEEKLEHLNDEVLPGMKTELEVSISEVHEGLRDFRTEWDESGWDPEAMADLEARQGTLESDLSTGLSEAHQAISSFRTEWDESGWDPEAMGQLEARQDVLEGEIVTGLGQVNADLQGFRTEWDENWDPDAISGLVERADDLEVSLQQGLANAEQSVRSLAVTGPRNINSDPKFETLSNDDIHSWRSTTDDWYRTSLSWGSPNQEFVRISTDALAEGQHSVSYGGNAPGNAILECLPGETFKARFQVARYSNWSLDDDYRMEFRWIDGERNGIGWSRIPFGTYVNQAWVEEEVTAPEGAAYFYFRFQKSGTASGARGVGNVSVRPMTTGDLTVDGTMLARHVDMEDFTADAGFIDNAFVNLIQGKMANFDQALIGGNLLKDRSITTRHLTVTDTTDFAPDPIDYAAAWDFVRARVTDNTSSFEGAAIALDNTATSDSQARGPILPVHPGDTIYVGAHVGWQGGAPRAGTVYLRMEWFEDATSSRETFTNVVSTTSAGLWLEGTTTVPDYATHARFYIYATSNSDNPGTVRIRSSKVRVQTGGELIVDGSLKARHGDFAEITASDAFLDHAMVNLIQGRMANFDQAIIGGALLKDRAISAGKLAVVPDGRDLAPDLVDYADLWTLGSQASIVSSSNSESGLGIRIVGDASAGSGRAHGPWIPVREGDTIYYKLFVSFHGAIPDGALRIYVMYNGSVTSWTRLHSATSTGTYEGHFTIPRDGTIKVAFAVTVDTPATNGRDWHVRDFDVRVATKGVHITPQGIKSPQVDTAELTASNAFLDHAMVNLIQGRMANFDEALIGGTLLKNNAVATRHLTVTNTEDLFPQEWMDDIHDSTYIFSPAGSSLTNSNFNARFFQEDPVGVDGNVEWTTVTLQGDLGFQVWPDQNSSLNQRIAFRLGPGKGIMVRPGEQYTLRCRVRDFNDGNSFDVRMALADVETGEGVSQADAPGRSIRGLIHGAGDELVWTFTIPDNFPRMWMVPSFHSGSNSDSGGRTILRPQLFRAMDGKLIVDGLLQAGTGILEELFFDSAVGNTIAASAAEFMTAHADHLIANAIDGSIITGAQLIGGELQVGPRFTGGGQSGVHITSDRSVGHFRAWDLSGDLSARLGGEENYLRGSLFAGPDESHGVDINYTSTNVQVGWDDFEEPDEVILESIVPRINFHTHHNHAVHPQIWVNDDTGSMEINPGRLSGSSSGSGQLRLWGRVHANRVTTRRLDVPSTSALQPGGLRRSGPNTSLRGRSARGTENAYEMFVTGMTSTVNPSSGNWRGGVTWSYPPANGQRRPVISGNLSNAATENWRTLSTAVSNSSTSGYRFSHRQSHGEQGSQSHYYNAVWF